MWVPIVNLKTRGTHIPHIRFATGLVPGLPRCALYRWVLRGVLVPNEHRTVPTDVIYKRKTGQMKSLPFLTPFPAGDSNRSLRGRITPYRVPKMTDVLAV